MRAVASLRRRKAKFGVGEYGWRVTDCQGIQLEQSLDLDEKTEAEMLGG